MAGGASAAGCTATAEGGDGSVAFTLPADAGAVGPALDRLLAAAERRAPRADGEGTRRPGTPAFRFRLRVAAGEALANAVLHGRGGDAEARVSVVAELDDDAARVTITDPGGGFDPEAVADPTRPGRRERAGGRGLFLLRALADEVRHGDPGNRVTFVVER